MADEIPSNIGDGRTNSKKQPLEDAMSHVEVNIGNTDGSNNAAEVEIVRGTRLRSVRRNYARG